MTKISETDLFRAVDATWPAHRAFVKDGWLFRQGKGGGQRVSAATQISPDANVAIAESEMRRLVQTPLFMIRKSDQILDQTLENRGYKIVDPVVLLGQVCVDKKQTDGSFHWYKTPTLGQTALWAQGGIGPARLKIMSRPTGPTCCAAIEIQGETRATAFVSISDGIAMAHAVEVSPDHRRQGLGRRIMDGISDWVAQNGAHHLVVLTVRENQPALNLYGNMGMVEMGGYHYRKWIE
jgi:ribosomal protein S18 acetylase RimI-like enzyme